MLIGFLVLCTTVKKLNDGDDDDVVCRVQWHREVKNVPRSLYFANWRVKSKSDRPSLQLFL